MRFDILTLHPEMCSGPLDHSMVGRARKAGLLEVGVHDLRDWAEGRHRQADDTPYGGGSGMVMRVDVVDRAISALRTPETHVVLMEASGHPFNQQAARRLARHPHLLLICGHYEGVDARVRDRLVDESISVGDYVLTGGELPAMVVVDVVSRLLPGVLGSPDSAAEESFEGPYLEYPHYTRPREYRGWAVPEVLLSGHHARIRDWRMEEARARTAAIRPDLLAREAAEAPAPGEALGEDGDGSLDNDDHRK